MGLKALLWWSIRAAFERSFITTMGCYGVCSFAKAPTFTEPVAATAARSVIRKEGV